jgi:hypothetical protein
MCKSKSPTRVVSTKAPAIACAHTISSLNEPFDMLQHRISVVACFGKRRLNGSGRNSSPSNSAEHGDARHDNPTKSGAI